MFKPRFGKNKMARFAPSAPFGRGSKGTKKKDPIDYPSDKKMSRFAKALKTAGK